MSDTTQLYSTKSTHPPLMGFVAQGSYVDMRSYGQLCVTEKPPLVSFLSHSLHLKSLLNPMTAALKTH